MPQFEIIGADGKKYVVEAPDGETAASTIMGSATPPQKGNSDMWGVSNQAMDTLTMGGAKKLNAALAGLVDSGVEAFQGDGFNYSDNYNRHLEQQRADQAAYNEESPIKSGLGTAAGIGLGITNMPVIGAGFSGALKTGAAYGTAGGALQDADSVKERLLNMLWGGGTGTAIAGAGYGAAKLTGEAIKKLSRAWETIRADPQTRANILISRLADDAGGPQAIQKSLDDLGPDAMVMDVLGERGTSIGRNASNISPEAREIMEGSLLGRKAGQNNRMVSDMERAAGLKAGSTATIDDMIKGVDDQYRPELGRLYSQARQSGKDIPIQYFDDVLKTQEGQSAFRAAKNNVTARARLNGTPDDVSNLAIIDEMKKIFDSKATSAFQSGDKASGGLYGDFAKSLRTRADALMDSMEDPIYKQARQMAQESYRSKDAITLGGELGASRVATNLPDKAVNVDLANRQRMAQGYVAKKTDTLLNRGSTDGALNELSTPMGLKAAETALGPGTLNPSVARERAFNKTTRALTGNSSTARQLAEMGGTALGGAATAAAMGYDATTGGVAGLLSSLARRGAPALARKLATDTQRQTAPLIAELLTKRGLPSATATPAPAALEKLVRNLRANGGNEKLVKALLLYFGPAATKANPLAGTTASTP